MANLTLKHLRYFEALARQGHFGLTGMNERAAKCDGKLTVSSEPGEGTTIIFTAPIRSQ